METYRLKNIMILTLVLVNIFLLGTLGMRQAQHVTSQHQATDELVALFAAEGVTLSESAVSFDPPPPVLTLERDTAAEKAMAASFLGNELTADDEGGGILTYTSDLGQAVFRASGAFEITGELGKKPSALGQQFCRNYDCESPGEWFDASGSGSVTVRQLCQGYPVEDCSVTFLAENGVLRSISGTFLPSNSTASQSGNLLTASTALTAFLEARRTSGAVVGAVTGLYPCYELQNAASTLTLTPTWRVVTDTVDYYVNCSTGAVTHV
jgi:regulatory protein YycI of two-component signal transduction system YycFG